MSTSRTGAALTGRLSRQGSRGGNDNHRPYVARYRSARAAQRRHRPRYGLSVAALTLPAPGERACDATCHRGAATPERITELVKVRLGRRAKIEEGGATYAVIIWEAVVAHPLVSADIHRECARPSTIGSTGTGCQCAAH